MLRWLGILLLFLAAPLWLGAADTRSPELNLTDLQGSLQALSPEDRAVVESAIDLIRQKEHAAALVRLAPVFRDKDGPSALRALSAYLKLQLGNTLGAFEDAQKAEAAAPPSPYRCWFLAKLAALIGNETVCRREIKHVGKDPVYGKRIGEVEKDLAASRRR